MKRTLHRILASSGPLALALWTIGCGRPEGTLQLPPQQSTLARDVDELYYFIFWSSVVFFVAVTVTMLYFVFRYRRRRGVEAQPTGHATKLEVFWTVSPLVFLFVLFQWGFSGYVDSAIAPADAIQIRARGSQWQWEFEYPNGMTAMNELTVPVDQPVKLTLSSSDVLHAFFVPAFRVKRDAVPGMYTTLWFEATELGDVQVFCAEYCGAPPGAQGAGHSAMLATIHVVTQQEYDDFLAGGPGPPADCQAQENINVCWGQQLYRTSGCAACHNIDGIAQAPAPNFRGLFGRTEQLADGSSIHVDENYLRESVLQPQAKVVQGYANVVMPPFRLSDNQIDAVIAYIQSLE